LLTWPVIVANITIPLVGIADTAVMGRMPEPSYIGAVAVGATIFSSIYWLFGFLRMATTGLAAQAAGAGDSRELSRVAARGLGVAIFISLLVVMLQWPIEALMFWIFEASEQVERFARTYFSIRIWSAPALMIYMVCLGMLFGTQRVRTGESLV
jgi:MATE family multidrug resistance protein